MGKEGRNVSEEGGVGGTPSTRAEISFQPVESNLCKSSFSDRNCGLPGTYAGEGEKCEKEGAAEENCYILTLVC